MIEDLADVCCFN